MSLYQKIYQITNYFASHNRSINIFVRKVNLGRKLWLLSILNNIWKIQKYFVNWPEYVLDCFGFIKNKNIVYKSRSGVDYQVRAGTIDVGILNEIVIFQCYGNLSNNSRRKQVLIDIGAHIGTFSIFTTSTSPQATIYALEPQKDNYLMLKENIKLNKLTNIIPINKAVYSSSGIVSFFENKNNLAGHSLISSNIDSFNRTKAFTITLNDLFEKYLINKVDVLKMDCEGSEYEILFNCPDILLTKIDKIVLEYHRLDEKRNEETLITFLKSKGFQKILKSKFPLSILSCQKS